MCSRGNCCCLPNSLSHAAVPVVLNGVKLAALIDSCSSDSFISGQVAHRLNLLISPSKRNISMALTTLSTDVTGCCVTDINLDGRIYTNVTLSVLKDLCSDFILGYDFQKRHKHLTIELDGYQPDLIVSKIHYCALAVASVGEMSLFANMTPGCKPIATKSRRFCY